MQDLRNPNDPRYCKAPSLVCATLDGVDVTSIIGQIYGQDRNWCCKVWHMNDVFPESDVERKLQIEWISETEDKRKHWMSGTLKNTDVINIGFGIPFGSNWRTSSGI